MSSHNDGTVRSGRSEDEAIEAWSKVCAGIQSSVPAAEYTEWVAPLCPVEIHVNECVDEDADTEAGETHLQRRLVICAPTHAHIGWFYEHYESLKREVRRGTSCDEITIRPEPVARVQVRDPIDALRLVNKDAIHIHALDILIEDARRAGVLDEFTKLATHKLQAWWRRVSTEEIAVGGRMDRSRLVAHFGCVPEAVLRSDLKRMTGLLRNGGDQCAEVPPDSDVVVPHAPESPRRVDVPRAQKLLRRGSVIVNLLRYPALMLSRDKVVTIKRTYVGADGKPIERIYGRTSQRGWSPQTGSLLELGLALIKEKGILTTINNREVYGCLVSRVDLGAVLGRMPKARDMRQYAQTVGTAVFTVDTESNESFVIQGVVLLPYITYDAKSDMVGIYGDKVMTEMLRQEHPRHIRYIHDDAPARLAQESRVVAGLARWLSGRWHGLQGVHAPIATTLSDIHREMIGGTLSPSRRAAKRFRADICMAVERINECDYIAAYGVDQPRSVRVEFRRGSDYARFYRGDNQEPVQPGTSALLVSSTESESGEDPE